ncbi:hypothetical protein HYV73_00135 [Candidatus Uhrbacteria bacterium]|nr:hypothetical protein [Candidatus Uhrbacteria bacterium]
MSQSILFTKKTKAELLEEYEKLQKQVEELKANAHAVHDPSAVDFVRSVKDRSVSSMRPTMESAKRETLTAIETLSQSIEQTFREVTGKVEAQQQTFLDLQKAIDLSRQTLEHEYHLTVAAQALEQLLADYEEKKVAMEAEYSTLDQELAAQMEQKRKQWNREKEEYEYATKLERARDEAQFESVREEKEQNMATREGEIKAKEVEFADFKRQVETFPARLQKDISEAETRVLERMNREWETKMEFARKESESQRQLMQAEIIHFQEKLTRQTEDNQLLRREVEEANKKSQELAVKVIENSRPLPPVEKQEPRKEWHQGNQRP